MNIKLWTLAVTEDSVTAVCLKISLHATSLRGKNIPVLHVLVDEEGVWITHNFNEPFSQNCCSERPTQKKLTNDSQELDENDVSVIDLYRLLLTQQCLLSKPVAVDDEQGREGKCEKTCTCSPSLNLKVPVPLWGHRGSVDRAIKREATDAQWIEQSQRWPQKCTRAKPGRNRDLGPYLPDRKGVNGPPTFQIATNCRNKHFLSADTLLYPSGQDEAQGMPRLPTFANPQ
ncbi:hypothetical protein PR048_013363 [Dryococelus australis]|uniref:Uncharacterized protein n=1 Tax=Dryococelus australis TaxID=614101 RepID=A0ABQ9HRY4_9NEOP|nr:hypothetical protein PR048_013363 [Dryococelus australis]